MLKAENKKIKILSLIIFIILGAGTHAQYKLSPQAEIHIVTCGPYQGELYSAFGHSAIRVRDPQLGMDWLFNYGIFDFNQPNFYLNFARGHLRYQLAVTDYAPFKAMYVRENRYIHEQMLNLSTPQKQNLFDFLQWNARPENRMYNYDYFYDNCATRVRDAVKFTFGEDVVFTGEHINTEYTIRDLTDMYLQQQPWGDLGIDLCLGLPMDTTATPWMYMFLPDYIEAAFAHARIAQEGEWVPLVKEHILTYEAQPSRTSPGLFTPTLIFSALLFLGCLLSFLEIFRKKIFVGFDVFLQTVIGLLGWFLLALWLLTDHRAAADNFNILWAFPLYFPLALLLLRRKNFKGLAWFYFTMACLHATMLLAWHWLPQDLHDSLQPLVLLLGLRDLLLFMRLRKIP